MNDGLVRLWAGQKDSNPKESKLELAFVLAINLMLWTMVVMAIWGSLQQTPFPKYPIA